MRPFIKVFRDLWLTRGRVAFMVLSLAAGLISMGGVLSMRGVLRREMDRNYMETIPASATIDVGDRGIDNALMQRLRERPDVAVAERRAMRAARWRYPGEQAWGRGLLFIIEDFENQQLALIEPETGSRAPGPNEVLIERSAIGVLGASIGDHIELTTARGAPIDVTIVGVVHEPALAPAITEQAGYFYATGKTFELLGEGPALDEVRVLVADDPLDIHSVETQVEGIATWLATQGAEVHEVKIPPPGEHPHEGPSSVVLLLFGIFSGLTVVLAAILSASLLSITMARQTREVAVMKTLGATSGQIRRNYALMFGIVAVAAIVVSVLPTLGLSRAGASLVGGLLNLDIASYATPPYVFAIQIAVGLALPLLTAAPAIFRASRVSVREAINEHGARIPKPGLERWIGLSGNRVVQAALRNALRVPGRMLLTVGLLAVGGGLFVSALSVADAWDAVTEQVYETRHYDLELRLSGEVDEQALERLRGLDGMKTVEVWGFTPVTLATESGLPLSRTYPDGGHGSFGLSAAPEQTTLIDYALRSGRWLQPGETNGVVLNQMAASRIGADPVGQHIELVVEGRRADWEIVGVVEEVAAPATAYVTAPAFVARTGQELRGLRLSTDGSLRSIERVLSAEGVRIVAAVPLELLYNAMAEHVVVLIQALLGLALLMAAVSVLALSSSMSTSVVERTREIGVLQAIGARPYQVRLMVLIEGLFVTLLSLPLALLLTIPLAWTVGNVVGQLSFELPLPLDLSWQGMAGWSVGVLVVAAMASLAPARTAIRLTVREALTHV